MCTVGINKDPKKREHYKNITFLSRRGSYQQHVARTIPVIKKWKSNTDITTKTACAEL